MLQEKITNEELEFMETLYYSPAAAECLFDGLELERSDNLAAFTENFAEIRLAQLSMISHEYMLDDDPSLNSKQNFQLKRGVGECFVIGGRKYGKTLITEKIDVLLCMFLAESERIGLTSLDALHIRGVIEDIIRGLENHPILRMLDPRVNRHPAYRIAVKTGSVLEGINMNLAGKKPGDQFFQKHLTRLYIEEASFETEEVYKKRIDAVSENGCVVRAAGMTNFRKHSPLGRIFYDAQNRVKVVNYPQYVSPKWDAKQEADSVREYQGRESIGYRIFVRGEVVEDGISVIDMERVRPHYLENKEVKKFEITKENFTDFERILILERFPQAMTAYVCADIGESAPTEIVILFELPRQDFTRYRYVYNITLYNLTDKQQTKVFAYIARAVQANFICIDCTDGMGRAIHRALADLFPVDNLVWVGFNEKMAVGFEKDANGRVIYDAKGELVKKEEYVSDWSIKHLKTLLYHPRIEMPVDYKLDIQLNSLESMQSGNRTIYECVAEEDHLLQAFQVFSTAQWMNEFKNARPVVSKKFSKVGAFIEPDKIFQPKPPEVMNG